MKQIYILIVLTFLSLSGCNQKQVQTPSKSQTETNSVQTEEEGLIEEEGHDEENEVTLSSNSLRLIQLKLEKVQKKTINSIIKVTGEIVPNGDTIQHIYPKYPGLVTKIYAFLGNKVARGQSLALIQNKETLTYYTISSLLSGTVINKNVSLGEVVPEDREIFTIANLQDVWVEFNIYTEDTLRIKPGLKIQIQNEELALSTIAVISYFSPVIDPVTRTKTARVVLNNQSQQWMPGMFVNGTILVPQLESVLAVPNEAVQILNEKTVVFVLEEGTTFHALPVTIGSSDDKYTQVLSGLTLDQEVVTTGAFELKAKIVTSGQGGHAGHGH